MKITDSALVDAFPREAAAAAEVSGENGVIYAEKIAARVDGDKVIFNTDSFSIYAIVDDSGTTVEFRRTYIYKDINDGGTMMQQYLFYNKAGEQVDKQILKAGEILEAVGEPFHNGYTFQGWYTYDEATNTYGERLYFENDANPTICPPLTADETVIVHAKYEDVYYVTFHEYPQGHLDEHGIAEDVVQTRKVVPASVGRVLISDVIAPQLDSNHLFYGWTDNGTNYTIYDNNNEIVETHIENVTSNKDLYPYFEEAFWLRFVAGEVGSRAQYVPPMFVKSSDVLTQLPVSSRQGYTFGVYWKYDGWKNHI